MNERIEAILSALRRRGVLAARELQEAAGVSAATLSRLLAGPETAEVVRIGRARATRYALCRDVRGQGVSWPLYIVLPDGEVALVGELSALTGGRWLLRQDVVWSSLRGNEYTDGLYPGLPWFLQDLRPRGFLGRLIARRCADELGLPADPRDWSDDDLVCFMLLRGHDLPGAFVLGRRSLAAAQAGVGRDVIPVRDRSTQYPLLADGVIAGDVPGSSAAGEQPKFTARVCRADGRVDAVIVKFSGSGGRSEDVRWRDLLIAEHIANRVLVEAGVPCAVTELLHAGGRCFLESSRFDRIGQRGRCGFVSLEAFDGGFFGQINTSWDDAAVRYRSTRWISDDDADRLSLLWWFGSFIGNTDMHYGNAGLNLGEGRPLSLAPTYDMVPMLYRPDIEGRLPGDPVIPPVAVPESRDYRARAAALAQDYWVRMAATEGVSSSFCEIAARNADACGDANTRR